MKDRRECSRRMDGGKCSVPRGVPRHVAVIMDGHRRFGRAKYGDPLKVRRHVPTQFVVVEGLGYCSFRNIRF